MEKFRLVQVIMDGPDTQINIYTPAGWEKWDSLSDSLAVGWQSSGEAMYEVTRALEELDKEDHKHKSAYYQVNRNKGYIMEASAGWMCFTSASVNDRVGRTIDDMTAMMAKSNKVDISPAAIEKYKRDNAITVTAVKEAVTNHLMDPLNLKIEDGQIRTLSAFGIKCAWVTEETIQEVKQWLTENSWYSMVSHSSSRNTLYIDLVADDQGNGV